MIKLFFALIACLCVADSVYGQCNHILNEVFYQGSCTKIRTYKSESMGKKPVLLVSLHGDTAPWNYSFAHYDFAQRVARKNTNLIAIGMLRPGYTDQMKRTSDGIQGQGIGDNYDEPRVNQIAGSIQYLKHYYDAHRIILAGQSGGAAIAANLIALHPGLVDYALLIACPCDINLWRKNMFELTKKTVFETNIDKTSPLDVVDKISDKTTITLLVGNNDLVTPPSLVSKYHTALTKAGKHAELLIIEGDHEIFFNSEALDKVSNVINEFNNTTSAW